MTVEEAFKTWYSSAHRRRRGRFEAFKAGIEYERRLAGVPPSPQPPSTEGGEE